MPQKTYEHLKEENKDNKEEVKALKEEIERLKKQIEAIVAASKPKGLNE